MVLGELLLEVVQDLDQLLPLLLDAVGEHHPLLHVLARRPAVVVRRDP